MWQNQLQPTTLYDHFWKFASNRQNIFFSKLEPNANMMIDDPVLKKYKFTNAYRVLDRTTQYLIANIINLDTGYTNEDLLFRILLFKTFNRISTWENLNKSLGDIKWSTFDENKYVNLLHKLKEKNEKIYSAAYIMPAKSKSYKSSLKHENHIRLLKDIMVSGVTEKIMKLESLESLYKHLLSYELLGPFLAYQFAIDINYSRLTNFDENEYIVIGPGAFRGIKKAFNNPRSEYAQIIQYLCEHQEEELAKQHCTFRFLRNRELKLIDIQNLFCEFDKYTREYQPVKQELQQSKEKKSRIKQIYRPNSNPILYEFPKKWGEIGILETK